MHLCYFDENKHGPDKPHFFIGGLLIPDRKALDFENTLNQIAFNFFGARSLIQANEFHGKELFHGKGNAKGRKLEERVQVFQDVATFVTNNQIPVRMVCINVDKHKNKYQYPMPAYRLGLMLILERFSEYLDKADDLGLVFGDYEADEVTGAVVDFSEYKSQAKHRCTLAARWAACWTRCISPNRITAGSCRWRICWCTWRDATRTTTMYPTAGMNRK